jgi:phosphoribosylamine--glycine ligase
MNILLIGSGGREHALSYFLKKSPSNPTIFATPGNPGIAEFAELIAINTKDNAALVDFCKKKSVDFILIGPEQPLAEGLSDIFVLNGIPCFGPSSLAARLETSKGFAKEFMQRYNIPTAQFKRFNANEKNKAIDYIQTLIPPIVIKADGLAAGKGVIIAESRFEAERTLNEMYGGLFGDAGKSIVIEEYLEGEEASIFAISDGKNFCLLAPSQDHKRIGDGDTGKNTGGMGAYAPAQIVTMPLLKKIADKIIKPALKGMQTEGSPYIGCLYAGLMINNNEPSVVEFNARFGDPETQPVLSVFEGDLARLLESAAKGSLDLTAIKNICAGAACCVVMASKGYPDSFEKGFEITGIDKAQENGSIVFHAGTSLKNGKLVTSGGRVLGVTAKARSLRSAIKKAYDSVKEIHFDNAYYRSDIGKRGI